MFTMGTAEKCLLRTFLELANPLRKLTFGAHFFHIYCCRIDTHKAFEIVFRHGFGFDLVSWGVGVANLF
jgi:hypothetical protein